jgi:uncharacterized protein
MAERRELHGPMFYDAPASPGSLPGGNAAPPPSASPEPHANSIFWGPNGIRAGWRLLIFAAILGVPIGGLYFVAKSFGSPGAHQPQELTPVDAMSDGVMILLLLFASWIMSLIEGRRIADYGLPVRKAFGKQFWQGAVVGFAALTVLLAGMRAAGLFDFGTLALHGADLVRYGALWGVGFIMVGLTEEFFLRGYAQFTLTTGMGFWPAAILLSAAFGCAHLGNKGEDWIGALSAGSAGFLFCFILRRTGDLWMPIGFHAAWDWGQTFFYGVPDSGMLGRGHMLNSSFHGSTLLTGGTAGPEGSVFVFVVLVLCWILFQFWLPEAKYPNPAALGAGPHRAPDDSQPAVRLTI